MGALEVIRVDNKNENTNWTEKVHAITSRDIMGRAVRTLHIRRQMKQLHGGVHAGCEASWENRGISPRRLSGEVYHVRGIQIHYGWHALRGYRDDLSTDALRHEPTLS